jgi:uncharacterized integral membrane protein (TIGR00698 family)
VPLAAVVVASERREFTRRMGLRLPGLAVVAAIAGVATAIGHALPLLGAPVAAIVLGVLISGWLRRYDVLAPGRSYAGKFVLQLAVVVLGSQLSLLQVVHVGAGSLPVMLGTLAVCLLAAYLLGRRMGIGRDLRTLIGVGTAICGASAIAAVSPIVRAKSNDIAYAISTIFLFNVTAVIVFPPIGHLLGMSQDAFGLFAGTAVNDTSSVVAAATSYGSEAGNHAVVVKLTRTLMIIPICLGLAALAGRAAGAGARADTAGADVPGRGPNPLVRVARLVPWFLIGFLIVAAANSIGLIPDASHHALQVTSVFLITMALAGIGLSTDIPGLCRAGHRPLVLGFTLWVIVAVTSLLLQLLT